MMPKRGKKRRTDHVERRRLVCTVGPQEREDRVLRDAEADRADDRPRAPEGLRHTEHAQRVLDTLRAAPLPVPPKPTAPPAEAAKEGGAAAPRPGGQKVAWGSVKAA